MKTEQIVDKIVIEMRKSFENQVDSIKKSLNFKVKKAEIKSAKKYTEEDLQKKIEGVRNLYKVRLEAMEKRISVQKMRDTTEMTFKEIGKLFGYHPVKTRAYYKDAEWVVETFKKKRKEEIENEN